MCMIIVNEVSLPVDMDLLKDIKDENPDGLGVIWLDNFTVQYNRVPLKRLANGKRPYIAHFRYATKGKIADKNLHPHQIDDENWLFHNGTVPGLGGKIYSDTHELAAIMRNTNNSHWPNLLKMDNASRFVTVDTKAKKFKLYGPKKDYMGNHWHTVDGVNFSKNVDNLYNYSYYCDIPVFVYGTLKRGGGNNHYMDYCEYVDDAQTLKGYTLEDCGIPYLHKKGNAAVTGELFNVDKQALEKMDWLEGHPSHYVRKQIEVVKTDGTTVKAWAYHGVHKLESDAITMQSFKISDTAINDWEADCKGGPAQLIQCRDCHEYNEFWYADCTTCGAELD